MRSKLNLQTSVYCMQCQFWFLCFSCVYNVLDKIFVYSQSSIRFYITKTFYSCYCWNPSFSLEAAFKVEYKSVIFQQWTSSTGAVPARSVNMSRHEVIPTLHSWRGRKWHQLQYSTVWQNSLAKLLFVVVFLTKRIFSFGLKLVGSK